MSVMAYTYEADYHCPGCAIARFGVESEGMAQWLPGSARDSEGNEPGAVFTYSEWWEPSETRVQVLACTDCGHELDRYEPLDEILEASREAGREHGRAGASWYFDGNTSDETYARVLQGIEEGDPEILDTFPHSPLSGEWAGDPTPSHVLEGFGVRLEHDSADEILRAYEDGFSEAVQNEIERVAREHAPTDVWALLESPPEGCADIATLYSWSTNYDPGRGPFSLFVDLIGWSTDEIGEPIYNLRESSLGYIELRHLAEALSEYVERPHDVRGYVDRLIQAETN
jgi:hypothetical protein